MANSLVSEVLRKDKEVREARMGFLLVAWLFGLWSVLRLPNLFIFFVDGLSVYDKSVHFLLTLFIIGVTLLAIRRVLELSRLRENIADEPKKYLHVKVNGPPVLTTIIPFLLK